MMKKILSLLIILLANITAFAAEKTVWEGNEPISWNTEVAPGTQFTTPEGTFTGLAKGDIIRAYTTTTYESPQYVMTYMKGDSWDWTDLETTFSNGVMTYTVADETIATEIATRWIVFRGQAYTLTKITVETPESGSETTESVIWEGTTALDWAADPGVSVSLEASKFANAKAGDILKIEGTATNEYTQIQVCVNYPWKSSDSYTALPINFEITADDLENIKANGMTIAGQYATITKVSLVKNVEPEPEPSAGETYTAWTGETVFTSTWSVWEQIPASSFAQAQKNMLLRFRFKNVGAGAQFKVSTSAWADMPDAELVNIDGVYQQYTITEAMLAELKANGCIVSGTSFTLISIEVINPADLKPLTLSVPVTGGDWVFENETPTFLIQATNPYDEAVTANAVISIATDKMAAVTTLTKEVEIAAGAIENIELLWTDPAPTAGFFKATCTVNDDLARAFFFGVNPTQIVSVPDKQTDFDTFWEEARDQLVAIEATDEPVLTEIISKSTEKRKVYLVEFKSVPDGTSGEPVTVRGYYAEPTDGKKHPVIMHYQGYDSGYRPGGQDATPWCFDGDGDELSADYAEFILSTRGQSINNRPASDRADGINRDFENTYGDWFAYNFGNKDQYYYRGAYMDCVRAIDFMATRPTSDMTNLYAEGQSQGGAFTYAAAALSGREFKAIAPGIAFMGDFPDYFEIVNWPAYVARECQQAKGMSDDEMYAFLSYFDTKNLSTLISDKVAVIATIGVQDNVCPPHTNIAPYNNLAAGTVKEISFNPENAHQVAANWYDVYMTYFKSKYVEPQPEVVKYTLTTQSEHGTITVKKGEEDVTGTTEFDYGTALTLSVTPESEEYVFKYWQIGDVTSTDNPYALTMNGNVTITAVFGYADENLLWKGTKAITWSDALEIQSNVALDIADQLVMEVETTIPESDWPQLQLRSLASGQPTLNGASGTLLKSTTTIVTYYLTKLMLADITANGGFVVAGNGYTLKSVRKVAGIGAAGYENSVWIGNTTFDGSWTGNQPLAASCFADAKVGDYLRVKVKNLGVSPVMTLSYDNNGWSQLPDTEANKPVKGGYVQYSITADMLAALQAYGMIITGTNFTLTSIDILDPATVKILNQWVDVESNWIFTSKPTITIKVENPNNEVVTANAELVVTTDKLEAVTTLTKSVDVAAKGTVDIPMTFDTDLPAGFYKATAMINGDLARDFFFGVNPTQIVSAPDYQDDFTQYWADAKSQLDAIPVNATLTEIPAKSGAKRKVYLVEMQSVPDGLTGDPVTIRGYYAEPTDGKRHPVLVHFQGYDSEYRPGGDSATPWCIDASGDTEESAKFAEFILSTRGQSVNNRKASERIDGVDKDFENTYGDWFAYNFGKKDGYYYRGAYMDCVRALDFLATRPTSDMDNLFAEGQSQGGAFTYAAAALSGRTFKAIAPAITFMGDFPDYFQIVSWPASVARECQQKLGMSDDEMFAFLSYYDTKNLATKISCPVITSIGVQDNVCPPHTNIAPYNNVLTTEENKKVIYNAELQHATNGNWNSDLQAFFEKYRTESKQDPEPEPGEKTENAQKLMNVLTSLYGNKIISGTTAYVDWNTSQAEQVYQWTNKYPAINTYDFINIHASKDVNPEGWLDYSDISGVKKWASEGGLVSAMWHWQVKNNAGTGYTCTPGTADGETSFDASKILIDGTAENTLAKQQLTQICGYLKKMKDAGIPVIWRPFHEAAGNSCEYDGGTAWFWWGGQGADVYKQLWQWMYNYMVNEQGLNNLIWVWTSQTKDGDWYPGNAYVDIIGRDIYGGQAAQQKSDFDALTASYPNMMVALSECGNTTSASQSDISTVWEAGAKWSWFSTWYDAAGNQLHNTQDWWTNAFNQDYVVTRDQMKELLDLNIEPDPEPQPEPGTNTFDKNGVADLSKVEVQDAGKVSYDATTHTVTTTEGWTGVQLTVADGEQVSGKELRVTFDRAMKVKCYVKYLDETDASIIMDDAAEILYFELDNTKILYQVQIQPTEAATFAFNEIRVNAESTKPVLKPLVDGEVRTLFEDEQGVVMAWNEICQMDAEWGAILETGESFLITVKSRTVGSEWPKVILRDANSESVVEVGLSEVSSYPYIVKILLTDDIVTKLRNGFRFSGDGITVTKIELSKPAPAKEGDVNIEAMNWFRNATYDATVYTASTSSRWGQFGWQIGDERYADKTLVIVSIKETTFPVTLKMEYTNTDGKAMATSMGVAPGKTQLNLSLPLDTKIIKKIYLTYSEAGSVVLTDAAVIAGSNARPLTGYEDDGTTRIEEAIVNALTRTHTTGGYYDLQGRRVVTPAKGLYIKGGKKIVLK